MFYKCDISPKMQAIEDLLFDRFAGMDHCILATQRNLVVEVPRNMCDVVREALKNQFEDVAYIKNAYLMIDDLHDFILVKPMISESPVFFESGVPVPDLEKQLVDYYADKEYASLTADDIQKKYQQAFEVYDINTSRLLRYAGRKGKKEEIMECCSHINQNRIAIVKAIQDYMAEEPVERAWLFGSFSRMEERPDSDIDILVNIDKSAQIGLLYYSGMINALEAKLGRRVDLVEEESVKPFARESINRDKVLIYERT